LFAITTKESQSDAEVWDLIKKLEQVLVLQLSLTQDGDTTHERPLASLVAGL
jgi:hypothetical protein